VLLTFNYSDCPVLCSTQLDMLAQALAGLPDAEGTLSLRLGRHYQVVTISLDPTQTPDKSRRMRDGYVRRFPEETRDQVRAS
jgi:protein SCO1/2